jgi:acetyl-CoA carboxylase carboxyl transferase subunit beta
MSISEWFAKKTEGKKLEYKAEKLDIPGNLWVKCFKCKETLYNKDLEDNLKVCPKCGYHFKLSSGERIDMLVDAASFSPYDINMRSKDILGFFDTMPYEKRIKEYEVKTGLAEAVITGEGTIAGRHAILCVMDFAFMGGSMGSVVGEKITRAVERAVSLKLPVIIVSTSGGARMQEGIMSLMQMAKTSAALAKLAKEGLPFISIIADPTTGGVSASFAMLGDIAIAEPNALIGFAGPRVIEQTVRQKLPAGFQRAEYLLDHGMIDMVVERKDLRDTVAACLEWFGA